MQYCTPLPHLHLPDMQFVGLNRIDWTQVKYVDSQCFAQSIADSELLGLQDKMSCRPATQFLRCAGGVTVAGNTVLGSSSGSLTVNSPAVFNEAIQVQRQLTMNDGSTLTVNGNAVLGSDSSDSVVVNGVTTFKSGVAFQGPVTFPSGTSVTPSSDQLSVNRLLTAGGSAVLGTSNTDSLTVNAAATFLGPVNYRTDTSTPATSSVIQFSRSLGTSAVTTGTVLGALLFTGWDGATDAPTAQIRSVHTVSF